MDQSNLTDLQRLCPPDYSGELALFLSYGDSDTLAVSDPYYGDDDGFESVLDLVEQASQGLLSHIQSHAKLR